MPAFSRFDSRRYVTVRVREGYRDWQPTYEGTVQDRMDLALFEKVESVPWGAVAMAADLGCGTGRTGEWLASQGVRRIDGVDVTPEMLEAARARGAHHSLVEADVRASGLEGGAYDLVVCCLVDEHLDELAPLYGEAARLLKSRSHLVQVSYHPFFLMAAGMPTHFDHPDGHPVAIETHLHLFADHVAAARAAALNLVEMHEGTIDDGWLELKPQWEPYRDWPISFVGVWELGGIVGS